MSFLQELFGSPSVEQLEAEQNVEALISMMKESIEESCAAIAALGRLANPGAVEPLLAVLEEDNVRKATIIALRKIGDDRAVEPLTELLTGKSSEIQSAAAYALGQIGGSHAISSLATAAQEGEVPKDAAKAIAQIGDDAAKHLAPLLQSPDRGVRWAAAEALSEVGPPAVEILTDVLADGDNDTLAPAAWALGETEDKRAVRPLIGLLDHPDAKVRQVAATELGRLEDARALEPLVAALDENQDEDVREGMVEAWEAITGKSWEEESA